MFADFIPTFFFILEHILFDLTSFEVAVTLQCTQLNQSALMVGSNLIIK